MSDRHQVRAPWHDYNGGLYFVTICCFKKRHYLGHISDETMHYSRAGRIALKHIENMRLHFKQLNVINYVVMPNHIHLALEIGYDFKCKNRIPIPDLQKNTINSSNNGCLKRKRHGAEENQDFHHNSALSIIISCFKGGITRETNKMGLDFAWQPRYHEYIMRGQDSYDNIMDYIDNNVLNWGKDCYYEK